MSYVSVKAAQGVADGTLVSGRARVRGIYFVSTAIAGAIDLRDGGASGTIRIPIDTPAVVGGTYIDLPEDGVVFDTDVYLDIDANVTSVTIFYDA